MNGNYFDPLWTSKVTVPMKRVGERWEFFCGGQAPLVALNDRNGNGGRLGKWPVFYSIGMPPGTTRFERITLGQPNPKVRYRLKAVQPEPDGVAETGGLSLKLRGTGLIELSASTVGMPDGFEPKVASSLNHSVIPLSHHHEKHRMSNTGHVYTRVFYCRTNGTWHPLIRPSPRRVSSRRMQISWWSMERGGKEARLAANVCA